jgi:hypothetical protein
MGQRVFAENAGVVRVGYVLPNKHYILVDMKYIGVDNTTPYMPSFNFMVRSYVEFGFWGFSVSKWGHGCRLCRPAKLLLRGKWIFGRGGWRPSRQSFIA